MKRILCAAAMSVAVFNVAYAEHHEGKKHKMMEAPEITGVSVVKNLGTAERSI